MKKRIFALVLTVLFIVAAVPVAGVGETPEGYDEHDYWKIRNFWRLRTRTISRTVTRFPKTIPLTIPPHGPVQTATAIRRNAYGLRTDICVRYTSKPPMSLESLT